MLQEASQTGQRRSALAARNAYIRQNSSGLICAPRGPERFYYDASSYTGSHAQRLPAHFSSGDDLDLRKGSMRMSFSQPDVVLLRPSSREAGMDVSLGARGITSALPILLGSKSYADDKGAKRCIFGNGGGAGTHALKEPGSTMKMFTSIDTSVDRSRPLNL